MRAPGGKKVQSGAAPLFVGMAVLLWASASFAASFPTVFVLLCAAGAVLAIGVALVLWAIACFR